MWHHHVHTEKAGESLYFWRVGFDPIYERDMVQAAIREACNRHDVGGLIAYELLGVYDILLRVWLPEGCSFDDMHQTMTDELAPAGLAILDPFQVNYMVRHWPFHVNGEQQNPSDPALHNLSADTIEQVDNRFEQVDEEKLVDLEGKWLLSRRSNEDQVEVADPQSPGIKFMMTVSAKDGLEVSEMERLESKIAEILDGVKGISQRSLYAGSGFGHFLILGRAGYEAESYHALQGELISRLNAAELREEFGTRTSSHLTGQRGYSIVSEKLSGRKPQRLRLPLPASLKRAEEMGVMAAGTRISGRFEIKDYLGKGGFAEVYRVHDHYEGVDRALKLFHSTDPRMAKREIAALRKVKHPNIAAFKWNDVHGSRQFIVFEFVDGAPLHRIEKVSLEQGISIVIEVLSALEALHPDDERIAKLQAEAAKGSISQELYDELEELKAAGLIHRDIKPENIMIGRDGRVVLVDFNIASPAREGSSTLSGTPEFFAPDAGMEHWDPADDLFSCGIVLFKLVTGEHPYPNARPVAGIEPFDPREFVADLPESLARVMVKSCRPLRQERYGTAREMRRALETELLALKGGGETAQALVKFRSSRTRLGISVDEMAQASGMDEKRITRLESGETTASPAEVLVLMNSLIEVGELVRRFPSADGKREHGPNGLGPPPA